MLFVFYFINFAIHITNINTDIRTVGWATGTAIVLITAAQIQVP